MYDKNIFSPIALIFKGNTSRLYTAVDADSPASDTVQEDSAESTPADTGDGEQFETPANSESQPQQEERTEEKETITEDKEVESSDNSESDTKEDKEAEETEAESNSESDETETESEDATETEATTEETSESEETETTTAVEGADVDFSLSAPSALSATEADVVTLLQENNELLQKQYDVTSCYLNLLTFTLLVIWAINSIHRSVSRMARRKEK